MICLSLLCNSKGNLYKVFRKRYWFALQMVVCVSLREILFARFSKVYSKPLYYVLYEWVCGKHRYLDFSSHHDMKHKISSATTLIDRSLNLPTTEDNKCKELKHVSEALISNGHPRTHISMVTKTRRAKTTPNPEDLVRQFFQLVDPSEPSTGYATLPYTKGITEPLWRTFKKHNIKVYSKPLRTLQREFPSMEHKPQSEEETNIVYKIPCKDCNRNYIGETGRSFKTRKSEHVRNYYYIKMHQTLRSMHGITII